MVPQVGDSVLERNEQLGRLSDDKLETTGEPASEATPSQRAAKSDSMIPMVGDSILENAPEESSNCDT